MSRLGRHAIAAALACVASLAGPGVAGAQSPGAAGIGDPYFPAAGNGGYQVEHYDLRIGFKPRRGKIKALATLNARATQALSAFNLDFHGLRLRGVTVNGVPAGRRHRGGELTVVPATPIAAGATFVVAVSYRGKPRPYSGGKHKRVGWFPTRDGAFVANEPRGAPGWFPCNDHPTDKATYSFAVTVPRGTTAVANGVLERVDRRRGRRTFHWREGSPMATYLASVTSGRFRLKFSRIAGLPAWTAVDPATRTGKRTGLRHMGRIMSSLTSYLGPYPFTSTGSIVDDGIPGLALEVQTRPLYGSTPPGWIVAHELAHQWFGNSVTLSRWQDIWLNEGFASWMDFWWSHKGDDGRMRRTFDRLMKSNRRSYWLPAPGDPGPQRLFAGSVYIRGALALEALRQRVGEPTFQSILRRWLTEHLYGNASTTEFIELAQQESGLDLAHFFDVWLFRPSKPRGW
jgi:aminopeptidase N